MWKKDTLLEFAYKDSGKPRYQFDTLYIKQGLTINLYSTTFRKQVLKIVNLKPYTITLQQLSNT
jgi:hypothetical protein